MKQRICEKCKSTNGYVLQTGVFVCRHCGHRTAGKKVK